MAPAPQEPLSVDNINPNVVKAAYAVRGAIVARAAELEKELAAGKKLPFDKLVYCNIGNPQQLGQTPITFNRQVGVLCDCPGLREALPAGTFPADVLERAELLMSGMRSTGAYSNSQGTPVCRRLVAEGIEARDGYPCDPEQLFMTDGASPAVHNLLRLTIRGASDAWLVPVPQYPLYSAGLAMNGGTLLPYYLDEERGWGLDVGALADTLRGADEAGLAVRAMVVINPGNPTGNCLSQEAQREVIRLCVARGMLLVADEVYQPNVYSAGKAFHSFKKVACDMGSDAAGLQLASLHSISKGFMGECGRRGGYMELLGASPQVREQVVKLWSVNLCSNINGQISMANQMMPPKPGSPSYDAWVSERDAILASLARRAKLMEDALNALEGVTCQPAEGAMYCFPALTLPDAAVAAAKDAGLAPDFFYCMQCLNQTGLVVVPGSGFRQREGTWHFRTTFLPAEEDIQAVIQRLQAFHAEFMAEYLAKP